METPPSGVVSRERISYFPFTSTLSRSSCVKKLSLTLEEESLTSGVEDSDDDGGTDGKELGCTWEPKLGVLAVKPGVTPLPVGVGGELSLVICNPLFNLNHVDPIWVNK